MTELRQGAFWLQNSRTRMMVPTQKEPQQFVPHDEGLLRSAASQIEEYLEQVDWENDPTSWQRPSEVPSLLGTLPMDEEYDQLFQVIPEGHPPALTPEQDQIYTIIDWTQALLTARGTPMSPAFIRYSKARWITFLNLVYPERDGQELEFRWFQGKDRATQERHLAEQFTMLREVFDWMIQQGMAPLEKTEDQVLPDLLELTIEQQMNEYRKAGRIPETSQTQEPAPQS
ncbi:hypothetical protein GCM10020260_00240 [Nesterenkonia halobia]|uniref:Uncharacterized protein n=1 Tax=Nesterenkonia halobia TaxID=37922 RepID=A0ABP6R5L0_9MICC